MFDTMTLTKILGGFCGAFLVFLLGKFAAETIYHGGGSHGGDHAQGYVIETGGDTDAVEEEGPSIEELLASADIGKGERVFNKCKACHKLEAGENSTGPSLYGVVGRDVGAAEGFGYSGSLKAVADVWTPEHLDGFLTKPASYAPGTSMGFSGLGKAEDRANVIAYLDSLDN
ncbi:cytochrome c family protein [Pseudohalocynthiibacter aestuariivivens]|uniref:Cytochrome c family protein n=1 Tax=Roseovarius pelagicus TaxID=2980108 RepID=A0ABY6DFH7_9RHOB|nr:MULTISPECIES: cytochrome c family protein [Rhodobacterales]QIE46859.1 cytochrome c family protein [Pseudohalocynthiibacter aestuariivivens]UXX84594.1 cytochrome c family protein [Roseovarius pelagicus]